MEEARRCNTVPAPTHPACCIRSGPWAQKTIQTGEREKSCGVKKLQPCFPDMPQAPCHHPHKHPFPPMVLVRTAVEVERDCLAVHRCRCKVAMAAAASPPPMHTPAAPSQICPSHLPPRKNGGAHPPPLPPHTSPTRSLSPPLPAATPALRVRSRRPRAAAASAGAAAGSGLIRVWSRLVGQEI